MTTEEPPNLCDECGLRFYYEPKYHECKHKGRTWPAHMISETWAEECRRKVMEPRRK